MKVRELNYSYLMKNAFAANIMSLGVVQIVNYIIPLITLPFLIRILGIENYGKMTLAIVLSIYIQMIIDYGFDLSAAREISKRKKRKHSINKIYTNTIFCKMALAGAIFPIVILTAYTPMYQDMKEMILILFAFQVTKVFFPQWLYQGLEQMSYIAKLEIANKLIYLIGIILFVKNETDLNNVAWAMLSGSLTASVLSSVIVHDRLKVYYVKPSIKLMLWNAKKGYDIFKSKAYSILYRNSNVVILGLTAEPVLVGYYAVAEKIIKIIQSLQEVVGKVLFVRMASYGKQGKNHIVNIINQYNSKLNIIYIVLICVLILSSYWIVFFLLGDQSIETVILLLIMSFVIFFGGKSYFIGMVVLLPTGNEKKFKDNILKTGLFSVVICILLTLKYLHYGAAASLLIAEIYLYLLMNKSMKDVIRC